MPITFELYWPLSGLSRPFCRSRRKSLTRLRGSQIGAAIFLAGFRMGRLCRLYFKGLDCLARQSPHYACPVIFLRKSLEGVGFGQIHGARPWGRGRSLLARGVRGEGRAACSDSVGCAIARPAGRSAGGKGPQGRPRDRMTLSTGLGSRAAWLSWWRMAATDDSALPHPPVLLYRGMAKKRRTPPKAGPVEKTAELLPKGYTEFLGQLKERIRSAQLRASIAVSRELIELYWHIGRSIVDRQKTEGWGKAVIDRLGDDLQKAFPGMSGFSRTNVYRMRAFYLAYQDAGEVVPQLVGQIGETGCRWPWPKFPGGTTSSWSSRSRTSASGSGTLAPTIEQWLEPERPRPLDRERPLQAPGQGPDQLREDAPGPPIRPCPGNAERPLQVQLPDDRGGRRRAGTRTGARRPHPAVPHRAGGRLRLPRPAVSARGRRRGFSHRPVILSCEAAVLCRHRAENAPPSSRNTPAR